MRQGSDRPDITERLNGAHAESDYDALADLFLGEAPAQSPATSTPTFQSNAPRPVVVVDHSDDMSELGTPHGPCCSRVGPIGGAATAKPAARRIDVLVLGSLPGIAATWATQHARAAAIQFHAPTCLLRLSSGQLVVDLVWPDDARPIVFPACEDAASALRLAATHAGAWMLRLQATDESLLDGWFADAAANRPDAAVDRVRLLTAAGEAAIINAYGRLKAWHGASPHGFARLTRVTIVEPDAARAAAAEARLRRATASFLETQLAPAERLGAMRPVRMTTLYCGPCDASVRDALELVRNVSREVPQAAPANSTASNGAIAGEQTKSDVDSLGIATDVAHIAPNAPIAPPVNGVHPEAARSAAESARSTQVASQVRTPQPVSSRTLSHTPSPDQVVAMIAQSAGIDTLRAAAAGCPWAPAILIAVDEQGEAHAIAFARDEAHVSLAAVDLLTASRWCAEHASLLAMAGVTPRAGDTTLHLLTTAPAAARRLADTGLRVHAAVRVGENWGAVALS